MYEVFDHMPSLTGPNEWQEWFDGLTNEHKLDVEKASSMLPRVGPIAGPQRRAFNSEANILGYGGAAGGGKSALMAILVLLKHEKSVIFRSDKSQLKGFIDDVASFYGSQVGLNRQSGTFHFADRHNHTLEWGGLGKPGSESVWQGRAHDFIGIDEATELEKKKVQYVQTWLRSTTPNQRCRCILTFNPPGSVDVITGEVASGRWIIPYFNAWVDKRHPNPAEPGELRYFIVNDAGDSIETPNSDPIEMIIEGQTIVLIPRSRTFIPAKVGDNPYQTADYTQNLLSLPKDIRARMLFGTFANSMDDPPQQILPTQWVDDAMERWEPDGCRELMSAVGVDPARGGAAKTALVARHGVWFGEPLTVPGSQTPDGHDVVSLIIKVARDGCQCNIDGTGIGASPYDLAKRQGMNVKSVVAAERQKLLPLPGIKKLGIYNRRTWLIWVLRLILDPQYNYNAKLPRNEDLRDDLLAITYDVTPQGILAESKKDVQMRLGRSVDTGDALLLSLYNFFQSPLSNRLRSFPVYTQTDSPYDRDVHTATRHSDGDSGWMGM